MQKVAQKNIRKHILLLGVVLGVLLFIINHFTTVFASTTESLRGFAWGGTTSADGAYQGAGWISMNNLSDGSGVSYGVQVPYTNGSLSGYAWSEHYGWISFNGSDLSGCSPALSQATRSGNSITGGARILAMRDAGANAGGFDGCISLSGSGYGLSITGSASPYSLSGYAWSSDLGWLDFSGVTVVLDPAATLSVSSCTISIGQSSCNANGTWTITNSPSPNIYNQTTNSQLYTSTTGTSQPIAVTYGNNTITARNGSTVLSSTNVNISCAASGAWDSGSGVCYDARPNLSNIIVTYNTSVGIDAVNGTYDSVTVIMNAQNTGAGSTVVNPRYTVEMDRDNNGYEETAGPANMGVLSAGQSTANLSQSFSNVPFGTVTVRITVDSENDVDETNESDNVLVQTLTINPPNPGLSITADRPQVRVGESTVLRWTTSLGYPMDCSVTGPNVSVPNAGVTGSRATQPIDGKSEYFFRCTEPNSGATFEDSVIVESVGSLQEV